MSRGTYRRLIQILVWGAAVSQVEASADQHQPKGSLAWSTLCDLSV
jgi:hypothetical protein